MPSLSPWSVQGIARRIPSSECAPLFSNDFHSDAPCIGRWLWTAGGLACGQKRLATVSTVARLRTPSPIEAIVTSNVIEKFVNQSFHIENDYIYQLNPRAYQMVPQYVIDECDKAILEIT